MGHSFKAKRTLYTTNKVNISHPIKSPPNLLGMEIIPLQPHTKNTCHQIYLPIFICLKAKYSPLNRKLFHSTHKHAHMYTPTHPSKINLT